MNRKFLLAAAVLAVATIMIGRVAYAGATISDKRYWPDEAGPSAAQKVGHAETDNDCPWPGELGLRPTEPLSPSGS
jgi:hypothetical protein